MRFANLKNLVIVFALFSVFAFSVCSVYSCPPNPMPDQNPDPEVEEDDDPNTIDTPATGEELACGADPVVLVNGKYTLTETDFVIPGRTMSVVFKRHYVSGVSDGGTVSFDGSDAVAQQGVIVAYDWRFPDEAFDIKNADTATPTCKFTTAGTYSVIHKVQDSYGNWSDFSYPYEFEVPSTKDNSRFGYGWDMCYNIKIRRIENTTSLYYYDGEGNSFVFNRVNTNPNRYEVPQGYKGYIIEDENGIFTYYKKNRIKYYFNAADNIDKIEDKNGNNISFSYTPAYDEELHQDSYKLTTITDDLGRDITLTYNDAGLLSSVTDFMDRTWNYIYFAPTHDLITVMRPDYVCTFSQLNGWFIRGATHYIYNHNDDLLYSTGGTGGEHDLLSIIDPNNERYIQNDYTDGRVTSQDYGDGEFTLSYAEGNRSAVITDRRNNTTTKTYTYKGNPLIITTDANSLTGADDDTTYVTTYDYDENYMGVETKTFPRDNKIVYDYDSKGNILTISEAKAGYTSLTTTFTYDPNYSFIKSIQTPNGYTTTFTYDFDTDPPADPNYGNLIKITYPAIDTDEGEDEIPEVEFTYNAYGQVETVTAADGIVKKYVYYTDASDVNNYGKLWKVIEDYAQNGLNLTYEFTYDRCGNIIEVEDPNDDTIKFKYDQMNRLIKMKQPDPYEYITKMDYNYNHKLTKLEREIDNDPNQIIRYSYDKLDHVKLVIDPLCNSTNMTYDKTDNLSKLEDAELNSTNYKYDERNLLWKATDAENGVTEYLYNENGYLDKIIDANGEETAYGYDVYDRLNTITYPDDTYETFGYDNNSNIVSQRTRKADIFSYSYNALDWLTQVTKDNLDIDYTYDIAGRVVEVDDERIIADGSGVTSFEYDMIGRVTSVNDTFSRTVSYGYTGERLTSMTYPDSYVLTYEYDGMDRLRRIKNGNTALAEYSYDELSRRTSVSYHNGTSIGYDYDLANRLTEVNNSFNGNLSLDYVYTYDNVGNRLSMTVCQTDAYSYDYDNIYQLTQVDYPGTRLVTFAYDNVHNRQAMVDGAITTNYLCINNLNQYSSIGSSSLTYDDNGNMTKDVTGLEYQYDSSNRLTTVTVNNGLYTLASYEYDYANRRVSTGSGSGNQYCYSGDQVIAEYTSGGALLRKFVYGPGIDQPVCMISSGGIYYYHYDGLGNVIALSNSSGDLAEYYKYDAFGKVTTYVNQGPDNIWLTSDDVGGIYSFVDNPYYFTGRRLDRATFNYYYRARYYSWRMGRFISNDPIGYYDSMNLYQYCGNNPVNFIDPWGLVSTLTTPTGAQATAMVAAEYGGGSMTGGWGSMAAGAAMASEIPFRQKLYDRVVNGDWNASQKHEQNKKKYRAKINKSSTRKEAKDKARNAGQGNPINHGDHFHAVDKDGNKLEGGKNVHYEHPKGFIPFVPGDDDDKENKGKECPKS